MSPMIGRAGRIGASSSSSSGSKRKKKSEEVAQSGKEGGGMEGKAMFDERQPRVHFGQGFYEDGTTLKEYGKKTSAPVIKESATETINTNQQQGNKNIVQSLIAGEQYVPQQVMKGISKLGGEKSEAIYDKYAQEHGWNATMKDFLTAKAGEGILAGTIIGAAYLAGGIPGISKTATNAATLTIINGKTIEGTSGIMKILGTKVLGISVGKLAGITGAGAITGILAEDSITNWASIDNIGQTVSSMSSKIQTNLRYASPEDRTAMAKDLEDAESILNIAEAKVRTSAQLNPMTMIFAKTWLGASKLTRINLELNKRLINSYDPERDPYSYENQNK